LAFSLHFVWAQAICKGDAMKALMLGKLMMMGLAVVVVAAQALAQQAATPASEPKRVIIVSLEDRKLALVEDGQTKKIYTVAVGKPSTPSPKGTFTIERRAVNPTYHHDGKTVLPGPHNPVGTRWMGLSIRGYGIHGTNEPSSIGKAASHGCIRMAKADLEEFYELVAVGDTVELIGQRNEQTAKLFGAEQVPAAAAQPVLVAKTEPQAAPTVAPAAATTQAESTMAAHAATYVAGLR
jgi:lipoprotein-anchoring transpeptidase ErfK/SrfK